MADGLRSLATGAIAASLTAATAIGLVAQQPARFRSSIDTVEVHVTVRADDGTFARGLTKDDFEIYDNGKRRDIAVFSAEVQPIAMTLLLDRSGSVGAQFPQVTAAARAFVEKLLPADRTAISTLTWECEPLTSDRARLFARLDSLTVMDAASAVWGGLNRTLTTLGRESGRRAVLLFSDGDDVGSPPPFQLPPQGGCQWAIDRSLATLDDVVRRAEREGVMVYTVSIDNRGGTTRDGDLRRIARESGGERFRLEREAELEAAFTRIADELHHQYLLGFVPEAFDGKRHDLDVRVKRRGLTVRARRSYVAARTVVAPDATPVAPLTDHEVEAAIAAGFAGERRQADCAASTMVFDNPAESEAIVTVTAEGPAGRVMRLAREARQARRPFTAADVTTAVRAPVVELTAVVGTPVMASAAIDNPTTTSSASPPPKPAPIRSALTAIRVRSREVIGQTLEPLDAPPDGLRFTPPPAASRTRLAARFDLAAFRSLPGDVEVLIQSRVQRRCTFSARDKAAIR